MKYMLLPLLILSGGATASPVHLSCTVLSTPYVDLKEYYANPPRLSYFEGQVKWIKDVAALNGGNVFITDNSEKILHLTLDAEKSLGWWSAQEISTVGTFPIDTNHYKNSYEWRGPYAGERSIYYQIDRSSLVLKSNHLFTKEFQKKWLETHGKPFFVVQFYEFQCKIDNQKI